MENYSLYPVLWDYKKNKKGLYRIKIAVGMPGRKTVYLLTPHVISPKQWESETKKVTDHANAKTINADIRLRITNKESELIALNAQEIPITREAVKKSGPAGRSFKSFAKEIRDHRVEIPRILNFGGEGLLLREITPAFLRRLETHEMGRVDTAGRRCVCDNTISGTMKYLGQILRQAVKEKLITENPFDAYNPPRYVQPEAIWLEEEEKQAIFRLIDDGLKEPLRTTAIYFLLACYSGIRHSDWAAFDPERMIYKDILRLRARKNKGDVVLPVGPTLTRVIALVRTAGRPYVLEQCNLHLKSIGPMAGLSKVLSTHKGRHSFGFLCASLGLPKSTTAELMAITVKTVEVYYHLSGANILKQAAAMALV